MLFVIFGIEGKNQTVTENISEIRIGYIVYPPLLTKDPLTGDLSGVSYDIVESVAFELGFETDWVEEVGWGTALEGLNTGRYDILGTQMWPNEARERVALFSDAPMDSVIYPYIKAGDSRFSADNLKAIDSPEFTISALDGEMAFFIMQEDYSNAKLNSLPQLSSYAEVFLNIIQNKADVTFVEPSVAEDFLSAHPNAIERLGDIPVRRFGNSFAADKNNSELIDSWNQSLKDLDDRGEIELILNRHKVSGYYQLN